MKFMKYADRETLERIKRWPQLVKRFPYVRIFSAEHGAFWRGEGNGYTEFASESKIWLCKDAVARTRHCGPEKQIQFVQANSEEIPDSAVRDTQVEYLVVCIDK